MNHGSVNSETRVKVLIVAAHDSLGGAARAIHRVFHALQQLESGRIDARLRVPNKTVDDPMILGGKAVRSLWGSVRYWYQTRLRNRLMKRDFASKNPILHSQAEFNTGLAEEINAISPDIVLFGWLGSSTISIEEIAKIRAPVVWRMSDLWLICGAEHYTDTARYAEGYSRGSRPVHESGADINRRTFLRKTRNWTKPQTVVALTQWMLEESKKSAVTSKWRAEIIPVPIDPIVWSPRPATEARQRLNLPDGKTLVGFGAGQASKHFHKGADLLFEAIGNDLRSLDREVFEEIELVIFGQEDRPQYSFARPIHYLGRLKDEQLADVYSSVDVLVVPSRLEAFGQVAAEAQMCGAPVVVFDNSGLTDVVADRVTGRVVPAFDTRALAQAIIWITTDTDRRERLKSASRERAMELWDPRVVARQYADLLISVASSVTN